MRTCCIVLPLAPMSVGERIDRSAWPPHVTLVGNVRMPEGATDTAAAVLRSSASGTEPFELEVGAPAWFGEDRTVEVDLVLSDRLRAAHDALLDAVERRVEGGEVVDPAWSRSGYRPHRTVVPGHRPTHGDLLHADEVALVELDPDGRSGTGVVLARWGLGAAATAPETTGEDVLRVLARLEDVSVPAWVIGGWGVDALVGDRTRAHHDLDLFIDAASTRSAIDALATIGYIVRFVWSENRWTDAGLPSAFVAVDDGGREVDVHTIGYAGGRVEPLSASEVTLPTGALDAVGTIGGAAVPCATAAAQLMMHSGYEVPDRQRGDLAILCRLV